MEQVTGIEPASPAWKADALTIVLHLQMFSLEVVSHVRIAQKALCVKRLPNNFYHKLEEIFGA